MTLLIDSILYTFQILSESRDLHDTTQPVIINPLPVLYTGRVLVVT